MRILGISRYAAVRTCPRKVATTVAKLLHRAIQRMSLRQVTQPVAESRPPRWVYAGVHRAALPLKRVRFHIFLCPPLSTKICVGWRRQGVLGHASTRFAKSLHNQAMTNFAALNRCACQGESRRDLPSHTASITPRTLDLYPDCHESSRQVYWPLEA